MLSENSGKIFVIKKIKINKKDVSLFFYNGYKLKISNEAYTSTYLYVDKILTNKEISELKTLSSVNKLINYAMQLLSKRHYSEYKIKEKLYSKDADKESVDFVIKRLKEHDLINDDEYAYDILQWDNERNFGKNKIIKDLSNKGIFVNKIKKLSFPRSNEIKKAKYHLQILQRKYDKYSFENKKSHIYNALISLGFDNDIILEVLPLMSSENKKEELEKLQIELQKIYKHYKDKMSFKELKNKCIKSLSNKGFKIKDIITVWENSYYENDC